MAALEPIAPAPAEANKYFLTPAEIQGRYKVESGKATKYLVLYFVAIVGITAVFVGINFALGFSGNYEFLCLLVPASLAFGLPTINKYVLKKIDTIKEQHKTNAEREQAILNNRTSVGHSFVGPLPENSPQYIYTNDEIGDEAKSLFARYAYWKNRYLDLEQELINLRNETKPESESWKDYEKRIVEETDKKIDEKLEAKLQAAYFCAVNQKNDILEDFNEICTLVFKDFEPNRRRTAEAANVKEKAIDIQPEFEKDDARNAGIVFRNGKHLPWACLTNERATIQVLAELLVRHNEPPPPPAQP